MAATYASKKTTNDEKAGGVVTSLHPLFFLSLWAIDDVFINQIL
jgi:hypothetical protein